MAFASLQTPAPALAAARMGGGLEPAPTETRRVSFLTSVARGGFFPGLRCAAARAFSPANGDLQ
jgi:hypothetical protein